MAAVPPAVRAIHNAIASDDLDFMKKSLDIGEIYVRNITRQVEYEEANPLPEPEEGEEPLEPSSVLLGKMERAVKELKKAIKKKKDDERRKRGGGPPPFA